MIRLAALVAFALISGPVLAQTPAQSPKPAAPSTPRPVAKAPAPAAKAPAASSTAKPAAVAKAAPVAGALTTDDQKIIYALGLMMQQSITEFDLTAAELDIVKRALTDGRLRKPAIELDEWGPKIGSFARVRGERVSAREKAAGVAYLAKAAVEAGANKTSSGLVHRPILVGTGVSPTAADTVRVHYRGTFLDGSEFDSSYKRNAPMEFSLGKVIGCWTEGVQTMKVGGKSRFVCPASLAYGDEGSAPIPGGATLIFEIELLEVVGRR